MKLTKAGNSLVEQEAARLFEAGMKAYDAELKRCRADKGIWKEQAIVAGQGFLKFLTTLCAPGIAFWLVGLPAILGAMLGASIAGFIVMFSPERFFRSVFAEYAERAYTEEIERLKREEPSQLGQLSA